MLNMALIVCGHYWFGHSSKKLKVVEC